MSVNSIPGIRSYEDESRQATGSQDLGKDEFVRLLMAQLSQQDPLAPQDSHAFVAQLAQFATVELLQHSNDALDALMIAQSTGNQVAFLNLVDKEVSWKSSQVNLPEEGNATLYGNLAGSASEVTITVVDENGRDVRIINLGEHDAGPLSVEWDGRDADGNRLPAGDYSLKISAKDQSGRSVNATTVGRGRVDAVNFAGGMAELIIGEKRIKLSDVFEVRS